jgi:hypothetical protein
MVLTWHVRIQVVSRTGCAPNYSFLLDFARLEICRSHCMFEFKSYPGPDAPIFIPSSLTLLAWIMTFLLHVRIQVVSRTGCAINHSFFARTFALDISRMLLFFSLHVGIQDISRTGSVFLWDLLRMEFWKKFMGFLSSFSYLFKLSFVSAFPRLLFSDAGIIDHSS